MIEKRYIRRAKPVRGGEDEMRSRYIRVVGAMSIACTRNRRCARSQRTEKRSISANVFLRTMFRTSLTTFSIKDK